ncbi:MULTISPECIES: DNA ligase D [Neobacillus]|jgi:bifunctional non-homologous end joining protein LigD|uniref:DNA ligase (ATP) n=1 Tax=Neobacillus sedimentimangrovi TaxID=2699460 RepID=A0ABS8QHR6_9BACI|nr:DNA ligase D [Neobacillus sedimentimangrovi]MCD4838808.1 DNA ligase D [Neobacillus sedimentimangrovi]
MKPMLPTLTFKRPVNPDWLYEVKYDGFRAILIWTENSIKLMSRNKKSLLPQFPEINQFLLDYKEKFKPYLPLVLDGELVSLINPYRANFAAIQVRGRLKTGKKVKEMAAKSPCRLLVFDLLTINGNPLHQQPLLSRKKQLLQLFKTIGIDLEVDPYNNQLLQPVLAFNDFHDLWEKVVLYDGEGIVAKHKNSLWEEGKRSPQWLKYKNWKYVHCFVTSYDKNNGYFSVCVFKEEEIVNIGHVLFGFKQDEKQALRNIMKQNMVREDEQFIFVEPAICLEVKYLELYDNQLREPHFDRFRFDLTPADCTYENFIFQQKNLPKDIEITHPEKPLWEKPKILKSEFIHYLREVSPYLMPFLKNRLLTVIRYPHGMFGEAFYQKNCPAYAPDFVDTQQSNGINYIVCNNLKTLIWLGNQLAIEYHIPFDTINSTGPSEIVFDLDPPSIDEFHLAIKAALMIKNVFDRLNLIGFIKTSGNKGLQIYLPLPEGKFTYDDTRLFTSFIAEYLVSQDPDSFTIERMKKNRGNKLYIDYVQHGEGKTVIAPYSLRGNEYGGIATPLFWDEVDEKLNPKTFTMQNVLQRIKNHGDPFRTYFHTKAIQPFSQVLDVLKKG